jgi:hypothetical protein
VGGEEESPTLFCLQETVRIGEQIPEPRGEVDRGGPVRNARMKSPKAVPARAVCENKLLARVSRNFDQRLDALRVIDDPVVINREERNFLLIVQEDEDRLVVLEVHVVTNQNVAVDEALGPEENATIGGGIGHGSRSGCGLEGTRAEFTIPEFRRKALERVNELRKGF